MWLAVIGGIRTFPEAREPKLMALSRGSSIVIVSFSVRSRGYRSKFFMISLCLLMVVIHS